MNLKELISHADSIPDLGYGGKTVKDDLMFYSSKVKNSRRIIDIAPCFGSTTAYISCGVLQNENNETIEIDSFDLWQLQNDEYRHKAKKYCNVNLNSSYDFYNEYCKNIEPYDSINIHIGDITKAKWNADNKIGLYIQDIGQNKEMTDKIFKIFSPAFIENETIIFMMDFYFYESHKNPEFLYQKKFMSVNAGCFEFIKKVNGSKCAIYKYIGGEINYEVEE